MRLWSGGTIRGVGIMLSTLCLWDVFSATLLFRISDLGVMYLSAPGHSIGNKTLSTLCLWDVLPAILLFQMSDLGVMNLSASGVSIGNSIKTYRSLKQSPLCSELLNHLAVHLKFCTLCYQVHLCVVLVSVPAGRYVLGTCQDR